MNRGWCLGMAFLFCWVGTTILGAQEVEYGVVRAVRTEDAEDLSQVLWGTRDGFVQGTGGIHWKAASQALPRASSSLPSDRFGRYGAQEGNDGTTHTSWSEGVEGSGEGQWLAVGRSWQGDLVTVYPGYGGKAWARNNRVHQALIRIYGMNTAPTRTLVPEMIEMRVEFPDRPGWFHIKQAGRLPEADQYILVLYIDSVHRGTHYDDTCIAELSLDMSQ